MKAYLKERLYVPLSFVEENISLLDLFTYQIEDAACQRCTAKHDDSDACLDCPLYETREIKTYSRDKGYMSFCRGNLGKIYKTFSQLEIIDQTTNAPFKYDLKFTSKLWENQILTTNKWLKYRYGMIESPPRSGKTCMSSFITCSLGVKTLVLTHQQDLLDQFLTTFENYTNLKELQEQFNTDKIVGITNCRGDLSNYDVCLSTYQSFITDKGKDFLETIRNTFGLVIVDECFSKDTEIMIDYDKYMTIQDIVENPNITHVLSYDLEKGEIVKKRILNRFKKINSEGWVLTTFEDNTILKSTPNHNIYTSEKDKVQAKDIKGRKCITYINQLPLNHYIEATDTKIIRPNKNGLISYQYNLEIENTHNYFVLAKDLKKGKHNKRTPILVSNCHLSGAECFRKVVNGLNAKYRLGLSATPERKDGMECLVQDILGPVTSTGFSNEMHCKVIVMNTSVSIKPFRQWTTFIKRLSENKKRNTQICENAKQDVDAGRYVLIVTERIKHIDTLASMLREDGIKVATYDGRVLKSKRKDLLNNIRGGQYEVIIAMRKMIKLGIDIPLLDTYYHIIPMAYDKNYYQEMSRVRTPYPKELEIKLGRKKPTPLIRVFLDCGHGAVFACYKIINKVHVAQDFEIEQGPKVKPVKKEKSSLW